MRILMLGNSLTFANDMPQMLAERTGAEVVHHTRGGARLSEQLNPTTTAGSPNAGRTRRGALGLCGAPGDEPRALISHQKASFPAWPGSVNRSGRAALRLCSMPPGPTKRAGDKLAAKGWDYDEMSPGSVRGIPAGRPGEPRPARRRRPAILRTGRHPGPLRPRRRTPHRSWVPASPPRSSRPPFKPTRRTDYGTGDLQGCDCFWRESRNPPRRTICRWRQTCWKR